MGGAELRVNALNSAIAFLRGTSTAISVEEVAIVATGFHKFLLGARPAATPEEVKALEAEKPAETTLVGS